MQQPLVLPVDQNVANAVWLFQWPAVRNFATFIKRTLRSETYDRVCTGWSPQLFAVVTSITIITMVYVGGMASIYGAVGGALLLTLLSELQRDFGEWRLMSYSLVLIAILFFFPTGLVAPIWQKVRQHFAGSFPAMLRNGCPPPP